jgi:replication factor C subunit 1
MDPSIRTVSFCGDVSEDTRAALAAALQVRGVTCVSWASNIDLLILGAGAAERWKYREVPATARRMAVEDVWARIFPATAATAALWVDRFAPQRLGDVVGHAAQKTDLVAWLRAWPPTGGSAPRGVLITGPPGIGKTTTVHCAARECGYTIVDCNASDERSATAIRARFETATASASYGRPTLILMDEVDGMSAGDRGGIGELARILKTSTLPIVCIANDRGTPKLRPLTSCCIDMRFHRPTKTQIAKWMLGAVVTPQRLRYSQADLELLCERSGNDIRAMLNALQFSSAAAAATATPAGGEKDALHRVDAFSATGTLFRGDRAGSLNDRVQLAFVDHSMVPLMVGEAYVAAAQKSMQGMERCVIAGDQMGVYDILDTRIHRTQQWGLLPAAMTAVVGAAAAADGPAPFQIFPQLLGKQSKRLKHRRWLRDLSARTRWTREDTLDTLPLLRERLFAPGRSAEAIVDDLFALRLTRDDMMDTLVETAFSDDKTCDRLDTKTKGAVSREWKKRTGAGGGGAAVAAADSVEDDCIDLEDEDDWDDLGAAS